MPQPTRGERVAESIRQMIRTGNGLRTDSSGTRWLPSYAQLRKVLGDDDQVSYGTVRDAVRELRSEGWIYEGDQGVGVRVREDHPEARK